MREHSVITIKDLLKKADNMKKLSKGYNLTVAVDDLSLSYDDVGEGDIPVIFLHGYPFDKTMWQLQLDFLKSTKRVIACDIRGFGKSTDEESHLSIDMFGQDLIKFMDELGIEKAVICGLSMGGFIALNVLKRFPDRFVALVLCDTQCVADTIAVREDRYNIIEQIKFGGAANFNEGFVESVFHRNSLINKKELVGQLRNIVFSNSKQVIIHGLIALAERSETCTSLHEITVPTMIICGREDVVTPLAQSQFMNTAIEGSILHIIENAGHVSNLEHPHEFNDHLLNFLTTLE